jgi:hypothetical protein
VKPDTHLRTAPTSFEMCKDGGGHTLVGHAAVFDTETTIAGLFRETIAPGAFKKTIQESDVRALFNHDPNLVLGRNKAGTLRLYEDGDGLGYEVDLPDTQAARDVYALIERGDVTQSSFAFKVVKEQRSDPEEGQELPLFVVREARLYDVSPVTYPAYDTTDVQAASAYEDADAILRRYASYCGLSLEDVRARLRRGERIWSPARVWTKVRDTLAVS